MNMESLGIVSKAFVFVYPTYIYEPKETSEKFFTTEQIDRAKPQESVPSR